ncbi:hypothetical protein CC78DRAFT_605509 [Lojkania enalia]|uniref:Uncharacterized protein n=1 Tax=Lojkania enalia TaxID=147567 RepID=A0A9P4TNP4_9PLEO|nr:hypothetical protein CC78DRAFT_605509 [Didymosphaeria enalia]
MAIGGIINAAGLAVSAWSVADMFQDPPDPNRQTGFSIGVGDQGDSPGGNMPHIAIWDDNGVRIDQYHPKKDDHIGPGEFISDSLDNEQNGGKQAIPAYVSVVTHEIDAICLAFVAVSGSGVAYSWTGDMAYTCGAQWYHNDKPIGSSNEPVRCMWMDSDHTNGIVAKGVSMHIRDFTGDEGIIAQYKENEDRLCKNTARMSFNPEPILPDTWIKMFNPPLKYKREENTENDPTKPYTRGALELPDHGIDKFTRGYPDYTDMNIKNTEGPTRRHSRDVKPRMKRRGLKNFGPGILNVSHRKQSAKELCESEMSLGPDFVSVDESYYCDMESGHLWPLCTKEREHDCFDLDLKSVRGDSPNLLGKRSETTLPIPKKEYTKINVWK